MSKPNREPARAKQPAAVKSGEPNSNHGGEKTKMQTSNDSAASEPMPVPAVGEDIQKHLGRKLKASYDVLVRQPVPNKFRQLLEELARMEKKH